MYRIDNATAITPIPAPAAVGPNPNYYFTKGNPSLNIPATIVDDDWANAVQEEICNVITGAGITLDKTVRNQLLSALTGGKLGRTRLTANTTFYVATTGNNSNSGLVIGSPWLTIQFAIDTLSKNYDLNGFVATIQVADGTYAGTVAAAGPFLGATLGAASVVINGNSGTPANVFISTVNSCFVATFGAAITVQNMKLKETSSAFASGCLVAAYCGVIFFGNIVFDVSGYAHLASTNGGLLSQRSNYSIIGGGTFHIFADAVSQIGLATGSTVTLTGTPAFSGAFCKASELCLIQGAAVTYSGAATGVRYAADVNSCINTGGGGASYFPGNSAGTTATGAQYI